MRCRKEKKKEKDLLDTLIVGNAEQVLSVEMLNLLFTYDNRGYKYYLF